MEETEDSSNRLHQGRHRQPGTTPIPPQLSGLIIRLANAASGYNDAVRIENEVAALAVARAALEKEGSTNLEHLIPRVFGWGSAADGQQGWIVQERMRGRPLLGEFDGLSAASKERLLGQMAEILGCFQRHELPAMIEGYGGLGFGLEGELVSAPLSILDDGPFASYEALVKATVVSKLNKADADPRIRGWRPNGVRERIDNFLAKGLHSAMAGLGPFKKCLVHADYCECLLSQ
jgi:hypothetical protein